MIYRSRFVTTNAAHPALAGQKIAVLVIGQIVFAKSSCLDSARFNVRKVCIALTTEASSGTKSVWMACRPGGATTSTIARTTKTTTVLSTIWVTRCLWHTCKSSSLITSHAFTIFETTRTATFRTVNHC